LAKKKQKRQEITALMTASIPSDIFRDRSISVLEAMVEYLKDELNLSFHEIAKMLNRDDRTVWTCYSRAKKKRRQNEKQA
jgi:hypothetical protein